MIETQKYTIKNRHGLKIAVLVESPDNPKGTVILCHGFKGFKEQDHIAILGKTALENNLISICFDMTHSFGNSDGDAAHATFTTFIDDLEDVVDWAKEQSWCKIPFILGGHSMGGIAILEYTRNNQDVLKAIAPIGTCVSGQLSLEAHKKFNADELKEWQEQGYVDVVSMSKPGRAARIPWSHMENRLLYNSLEYAHEINIPVLLFTGTKDTSCPPEHHQMLYDALGSKDKEFHVLEDFPHTYRTEKELGTLGKVFDAWLKKVA